MLSAIAFVPAAPVLVPAISGPAAHEVQPVRDATAVVATRLGDLATTWWAIGVDTLEDDEPVPTVGSFAEFGVPLRVSLAPDPKPGTEGREPSTPDVTSLREPMPTSMLIAAWLRERYAPGVRVRPLLVGATTTPARCAEVAADLIATIAATEDAHGSEPVGLLVVADGSIGLNTRAPGGLIPGAAEMQAEVDAALSSGDLDALAALDEKRCQRARLDGRPAWQVAGEVWRRSEDARPAVDTLYAAAPFGVGYHVAWWSR